jgi:nitroreductase
MRAMRRLKPDPVPDELLARLVEAATWAPSAANIQGFSFVVVTDRKVTARVAELWRVVCDFYLAARPPDPAGLALAPGSIA